MEPKYIDNSKLDKWMIRLYKIGFVPYFIIAIVAFFFLKTGVILAILYIGMRTEFLIASLRYGDTINSRRLEVVEEYNKIVIDYELLHSRKG
tara:strand:- start:7952 stop:8227 length:276 start_codon:yes stop_codon:yes gene_type:complete